MLCGRKQEMAVIDRLLDGGGALIVRGEPGIGKTALIDYAVAATSGIRVPGAAGMRILRATGIEAEADLPFAALHLLLRPLLDRIDALPDPQRAALRGAFELAPVTSADRFLIGLAVLSLLSEAAHERPLLCVIDDAHWLDRASADTLLFAARRLGTDRVALLFATRSEQPTPGLDEVRLAALNLEDSAALLSQRASELSPMARRRLLAEAAGNPLALLELPADEASSTGDLPLAQRVQDTFQAQIHRLPEQTRLLLLVAASDSSPDLDVVLGAGKALGAPAEALDAAQGLITVAEGVVTFRHPLVRAAVYRGAPPVLRLAVHAALAELLATPADADRRAWHLAAASAGPDEHAASELERTAVRAGERSGFGSAAIAYARAARLSPDPAQRARRNVLAAEAAAEAGDLDLADELAELASGQTASRPLLVRIAMTRSTVNSARGRLRTAHALLLEAAELDPANALWPLMGSMFLAWNSGENDLAAETLERLATLRMAPDDRLTPVLQLAVWSVTLQLDLPPTGLPPLPDVTRAALRLDIAGMDSLILICGAGLAMGHDRKISELAAATVGELRAQVRIGPLPAALTYLAAAHALVGGYGEALSEAEEALRIARDTTQAEWVGQASSILAYIAAIQGDEHRRATHAESAGSVAVAASRWSMALLDLGYGRAEQALTQLENLAADAMHCQLPVVRSTPDLIEAAVRVGRHPRARAALRAFESWAGHIGLAWSDALVARCRALVEDLEEHYVRALELHADDTHLFDQARTRLLYGEWLRRARRKAEARGHLQGAANSFDQLGAAPWAARARAELGIIGASGAAGPGGVGGRLTPQELQIVRLAARGMSNRDIAAQLFLSHRTVGHHLYKAYPKLGITGRGELAGMDLG
ncbi:AAA family ATPase [Nonomuraea soli]|uniref:DNA-binding CsgD family transcriptional regulator n=1 Tax=Nonomuraea soli TaxID=1032476 RepID=A0A7W0CUB5_9ACTN|nr:LuxR family transcriptional regulator [Nonomuraea soli]MBA2897456.1 DNA-binding CsgD family transcriptional regulator [Nonomuraea soli]